MANLNKDSLALTPVRRRRSSTEESIVVDITPQRENTPSRITGSRKRPRIDYNTLKNHGFQGSILASPSTNSTAKRAQMNALKASGASQQSTFTAPDLDEQIDEPGEEENSGGGKRAWWWEYFTVTTLSTTFEKGRGKKTVTTPDERYTCKLCKNARPFVRLASKLHGAASAMKYHVENKHNKYENSDENAGKSQQPTSLQKYLKSAAELPPFEETLVDWIVETGQSFTVTETESFRTMMKAAGCNDIIKGDTIAARSRDRLISTEKKLKRLLEETSSTATGAAGRTLGRG